MKWRVLELQQSRNRQRSLSKIEVFYLDWIACSPVKFHYLCPLPISYLATCVWQHWQHRQPNAASKEEANSQHCRGCICESNTVLLSSDVLQAFRVCSTRHPARRKTQQDFLGCEADRDVRVLHRINIISSERWHRSLHGKKKTAVYSSWYISCYTSSLLKHFWKQIIERDNQNLQNHA